MRLDRNIKSKSSNNTYLNIIAMFNKLFKKMNIINFQFNNLFSLKFLNTQGTHYKQRQEIKNNISMMFKQVLIYDFDSMLVSSLEYFDDVK